MTFANTVVLASLSVTPDLHRPHDAERHAKGISRVRCETA
jgi:hypothetical protein